MRQRRRQSGATIEGRTPAQTHADVDEHRARHVERRLRVAVEGVLDLAQRRERVADELDGGAAALLLRGARRCADEAHVEPQQPDLRRAQMTAGRAPPARTRRRPPGPPARRQGLRCRPAPPRRRCAARAGMPVAARGGGARAARPPSRRGRSSCRMRRGPVASRCRRVAARRARRSTGRRVRRHDVHVSAQEQRAPGRPPTWAGGCHVATTFRLALTSQSRRACSGCAPSTAGSRRDVGHLEADRGERVGHQHLARLLVAAQRRGRDQRAEQVLDAGPLGLDGRADLRGAGPDAVAHRRAVNVSGLTVTPYCSSASATVT